MREPDYDAMSDGELLERCRAARALLTDARRYDDEDAELVAFMAIFHPDHPKRPRTREDARAMRGKKCR